MVVNGEFSAAAGAQRQRSLSCIYAHKRIDRDPLFSDIQSTTSARPCADEMRTRYERARHNRGESIASVIYFALLTVVGILACWPLCLAEGSTLRSYPDAPDAQHPRP